MRLIVLTIRIDADHDCCKVRRLLKTLLRSYGLRCVDIAPEHEQAEARKRQSQLNGKTQLVETLPQADQGKSRDKVGARVGVSGIEEPKQ